MISRALDIYGLFKMVFDCLWVLVDGCRSFPFLVTMGLEKGFHKTELPHTPGWVKEVASQAQVYIRPLQKDLQLKAPVVDASSHDEVFSNKHIFL